MVRDACSRLLLFADSFAFRASGRAGQHACLYDCIHRLFRVQASARPRVQLQEGRALHCPVMSCSPRAVHSKRSAAPLPYARSGGEATFIEGQARLHTLFRGIAQKFVPPAVPHFGSQSPRLLSKPSLPLNPLPVPVRRVPSGGPPSLPGCDPLPSWRCSQRVSDPSEHPTLQTDNETDASHLAACDHPQFRA